MNASGDAKGFLIDGFPRNQDNLDGWQKEMGDKVRSQKKQIPFNFELLSFEMFFFYALEAWYKTR